jgi:phosphatidylethanolamine/phosphatidyl-N-methylethanolamine N-methyltransferase
MSENRLFLSRWLRNPLGIGAVLPSSRRLAEALARPVAALNHGTIVELGGGTGTVTAALLDSGIDPGRLVVVERDTELHRHLARRFDSVRILCGDAAAARSLLAGAGVGTVAAIVSSLPLLSMPVAARHAIVAAAFDVLDPEGVFVQFTYGPASPFPAATTAALGLVGEPIVRVWRNVPPAVVWRFARAKR